MSQLMYIKKQNGEVVHDVLMISDAGGGMVRVVVGDLEEKTLPDNLIIPIGDIKCVSTYEYHKRCNEC